MLYTALTVHGVTSSQHDLLVMLLSCFQVDGDIYFNGTSTDEFHHRKSSVYVAQSDNHEPNLTVTETLDFAWSCQVGVMTYCMYCCIA